MKIQDDLLISYLLKEADPIETIAVEKWLEGDPDNIRELDRFRLVLETANSIQLQKQMDAHSSLDRFKQRSRLRQTKTANVVPLRRSYAWMKIAAALLLMSGGGVWFYLQRSDQQVVTSTSRLEVKADTLSDGSIVTLNQNTVFSHATQFRGKTREVALKNGEAFFKIAHLADKPFVIRTGKLKIQVLGTSFNVKSKAGRVEVIVETGMVAVINDLKTTLLRQGDKLNFSASDHAGVISHHTDHLYQYYRTKEFIADNTPLINLVAALNEAYSSQIIIANPKLRALKLNATFSNNSLDDILDVVSRTFNIQVIKSGDTILLK